jgi:hypothetical protein
MEFPPMIRLRNKFEASAAVDIDREIISGFRKLASAKTVKAGASVAVGCSSRGIADYPAIVKATVGCLRDAGLKPFLFPAMGSHGAATAAGQKKVLESYGVSENTIGAPIRSSLDTVQIGQTEDGVPVLIDKMASEADYIVLINRITSHTEFEHEFESGLLKMMAIGMGKEKGASLYHKAFMVYGYPRVILSVARKVIQTGRILCGVGIVENGYGRTTRLEVLSAEEIIPQEKVLLKEAKRLAPGLPFADIDVLIIDEMGKDISGSGLDTKVVGRILMPLIAEEPETPRVKRIVVCDLTQKTDGNADGIGIADFVTRRLVDKIDFRALYVNALAGGEPEHAKIPLTLANDREALQAAIDSVGLIQMETLRIIRIRNTRKLSEVDVSTAYRPEISERSDLEILSDPRPFRFDPNDNLEPFTFSS